MRNHLNSYTQRLHILMEKVIAFNSKAIFVSQSKRRNYDIINGQLVATSDTQQYNQYIINGIDYYHMSRLLNAHTKSVCDAYKECIFFDLDEELTFNIETDFYDSIHTTLSGSKKIGEYLFNKLNSYY